MAKVQIKVKDVDGNIHLLVVDEEGNKSIIDLAEEQDIELPYSCRSGACFSCCAKVTKWANCLEKEKTGEQLIDTEDDEVLTCICGLKKECFEGDEDKEIEIEMLN